MRKMILGCVLAAVGVGFNPSTAEANGLLRRRFCTPACATVGVNPCDSDVAPPGYKWVTVQEPYTYTEYVQVQSGTGIQLVPVTRTGTRPVRMLVADSGPAATSKSITLQDLQADLERLQKAIGVADPRSKEDQEQKLRDLAKLKKQLDDLASQSK